MVAARGKADALFSDVSKFTAIFQSHTCSHLCPDRRANEISDLRHHPWVVSPAIRKKYGKRIAERDSLGIDSRAFDLHAEASNARCR